MISRLSISPVRQAFRPGALLLAGSLALWSVPAIAQAPPERLGDKDVKALADQLDTSRDKFEGNLDGSFKGSTVQRPTGEVKVAGALQDYQDSTKKLQDRFNADYAAAPEVSTILKQAALIGSYMKSQPASMNGRTEWDRHVTDLERLAAVYGTMFPMPEGATAQRANDKEPMATAASVATAGNLFKSELDKDATLAKPEKEAAKKDTELLVKQANAVKDRINDGKPATSDVKLLAEHAAKIQAFLGTHPIASANWPTVQASLASLQRTFGLVK
jgi:hypothetical protein